MKKITLLFVLVFMFALPLTVSAQETPSVIKSTIPIDPLIRSRVDEWLRYDAPIPLPYWAITYVGEYSGGKFVSIVALNIDNPTVNWHVTDNAAWMGSLILYDDGRIEMYSDGNNDQQASAIKQAMPRFDPGGGSNIAFPWEAGSTMMYGPSGVHAAGGGGAYATGFSAVDFLGGDDLGSGVASNRAYAVAAGTVDYVCADNTTTLIRTTDEATDNSFIYAHLLDNANLEEDHEFSKGALIGSLKYGTFDDSCGWASQTAKHYHLHFGFEPANNSFRMEGCILNTNTEKWTCGTQTVSTGEFLRGGGGGTSTSGDDVGINSDQPSFWDYALSGAVSIWDRTLVAILPSHQTMQYTYVIYGGVKIALKVARVMVYSNLNLGHLIAIVLAGVTIKFGFGVAEFIVFLFKAWKSLIPIMGS